MNNGNFYTYSETNGGASLHWTVRVDASGSRVEWHALSDPQGWVCNLGSVHNDGVSFGSKVVGSQAEEKALLDSLRSKVFANGSGIHSPHSFPHARAA